MKSIGSSLFRVGNQKNKQPRVDSFLSQSEGRASLAVAKVHRACEAKAVKAAKRSEAPEGLGLDCLGFACQPVLQRRKTRAGINGLPTRNSEEPRKKTKISGA